MAEKDEESGQQVRHGPMTEWEQLIHQYNRFIVADMRLIEEYETEVKLGRKPNDAYINVIHGEIKILRERREYLIEQAKKNMK